MTLYSVQGNVAVAWAGEPIDDVRYPLNIESLWTVSELLAVGLYIPLPADAVPEGKEIESTSVEIVNGVPKFVDVLIDIPTPPPPSTDPNDYTTSKRQICAALIMTGTIDPDGFITGVINSIPDTTARAMALNDWHNAPYYKRDNPLFNDPSLLAAANMTAAQVDGIWMLAKDQPR